MLLCCSPFVYWRCRARELGSLAAACRVHGIHRSPFYRWNTLAERRGPEILILRPRERRRPQMPNLVPLLVEERIVAFALGRSGYGPAPIAFDRTHNGRHTRGGGSPPSCSGPLTCGADGGDVPALLQVSTD